MCLELNVSTQKQFHNSQVDIWKCQTLYWEELVAPPYQTSVGANRCRLKPIFKRKLPVNKGKHYEKYMPALEKKRARPNMKSVEVYA